MNKVYDLSKINRCLVEMLSNEDLLRLCYDDPTYTAFYKQLRAEQPHQKLAQSVVQSAHRLGKLGSLLETLQALNPTAYQAHEPFVDLVAPDESTDGDEADTISEPESTNWFIINFSGRALTRELQEAVQHDVGWGNCQVIDARIRTVSEDQTFVENVQHFVTEIPLSEDQWQTAEIVVVPASYAPVWSVVLSALHGRMGYFPDVVHIRPVSGSGRKYEVAGIIQLQQIRNQNRPADE